ncbi:FG-GAP repeat domain-containing protein [Streptomyces sp. NPDC008238]
MTDPHSPGGRKRRSIAVLLALGLPLTAASTLVLPPAEASAAATDDPYGPTEAVKVTNANGTPADDPTNKYQARKTVTLNLYNSANDLAGFCWRADFDLSVSNTPCEYGTWVDVGPDHHTATITVTPSNWPVSTLYVVAYDTAGNPSPLETAPLSMTKSDFVYAPGQDPGTGLARQDLPGDVNGDGYADIVATDKDGKLRLYAGDGTGGHSAAQFIGTSGWGDALIAHHGDLAGFTSPDAAPDGYEDYVVRLANDKLYIYGGNGLGEPVYDTRHELVHPPSLDDAPDWRRIRQLTLPGDIDKNTTEGHAGGNDLLTIECVDDACTDAALWLYTGNTFLGAQDPTEPFDLDNRVSISPSGWKDLTVLAVGDQSGDGVQDLLVRTPSSGMLDLYPGRLDNGVLSLGTPSVYGSADWQNRPHLASPGNVQGTVVTATYDDPDAGTSITYRQFQPTPGETSGDLWATTPADPDYTVDYVDDTGAAKSTTCPNGCLLFYPGGPATVRSPRLVGTSGWDTTVTNIF